MAKHAKNEQMTGPLEQESLGEGGSINLDESVAPTATTVEALAGAAFTDRLSMRTRRAFLVTTGSRIVVQLIQFAATVVLARLLTPNQFGLVAIISSFSGFAYLFTDLGIGTAIVHRKALRERDLASAFWLNFVSGVALTLLFVALAKPISLLYGLPQLFPLIMLSSLSFTLSLNVVHYALLQRGLRFGTIGLLDILTNVVSGTVGITGAILGLGAYSLVLSSLASLFVSSVSSWVVVRWVPRIGADRESLRELWDYSKHIFGFNTMTYWVRNADDLVLGRTTTPANLALYARAYNLMLLPIYQVTQIVNRVLFPVLAGVRDDVERLRRGYLRANTALMTIGTPATVGLAAIAPAFVHTVYGPRWDGVAPLLAILASSGPAQIISGTFSPLYQATGRVKQQFRRGIINTTLTLVAIGIGAFWGPEGVATALLIKFYVQLPIAARGCLPPLGLSLLDIIRPLWSVYLASLVMVAAVLAVHLSHVLPLGGAQLALQVAVGFVAYMSAINLFDREAVIRSKHTLFARG